MYKLITIIVLIQILTGCIDNKNHHRITHDGELSEFLINPQKHSVKISDVIDSSNIIILKFPDGKFVNEISKIKYADGLFYLKDEQRHAIFVFKESGEFFSKIDAKGRGPGEYSFLNDFCVKGDTIHVLSRNRVYKYSTQGEFLEKIELEFVASGIAVVNGDYVLYRGKNTAFNDIDYFFDIITCNSSGKTLNKYFPYQNPETVYAPEVFFINNSKTCFIPPNSNIIYCFKESQPLPKYKFQFRDKKNRTVKNYAVSHFYEDSSVFALSVIGDATGSFVFSKMDSTSLFYNSIIGDEQFLFIGETPKINYNEKVVSVLDLNYMNFFLEENERISEKLIRKYPRYRALFDYIESESLNPVLVVDTYQNSFSGK